MNHRVITLYTRPGCGLCEEVEDVLLAVQARRHYELVRVNILDDPAAYDRYKHDIPVVLVDGREIARHHLTEAQFQAALG